MNEYSFFFPDIDALDIIIVVCALIFMASIGKIISTAPSLIGCFFRWKDLLKLEYNIKLGRDRDYLFAAMILPACLVGARFRIFDPPWLQDCSSLVHFAAVTGVFILFLGLRVLMWHVPIKSGIDRLSLSAGKSAFRTFFCSCTILAVAASGVMAYANVPLDTAALVIKIIVALSWVVLIVRETQIFIHSCAGLPTFLYLCTLEIVPDAALVAVFVLF